MEKPPSVGPPMDAKKKRAFELLDRARKGDDESWKTLFGDRKPLGREWLGVYEDNEDMWEQVLDRREEEEGEDNTSQGEVAGSIRLTEEDSDEEDVERKQDVEMRLISDSKVPGDAEPAIIAQYLLPSEYDAAPQTVRQRQNLREARERILPNQVLPLVLRGVRIQEAYKNPTAQRMFFYRLATKAEAAERGYVYESPLEYLTRISKELKREFDRLSKDFADAQRPPLKSFLVRFAWRMPQQISAKQKEVTMVSDPELPTVVGAAERVLKWIQDSQEATDNLPLFSLCYEETARRDDARWGVNKHIEASRTVKEVIYPLLKSIFRILYAAHHRFKFEINHEFPVKPPGWHERLYRYLDLYKEEADRVRKSVRGGGGGEEGEEEEEKEKGPAPPSVPPPASVPQKKKKRSKDEVSGEKKVARKQLAKTVRFDLPEDNAARRKLNAVAAEQQRIVPKQRSLPKKQEEPEKKKKKAPSPPELRVCTLSDMRKRLSGRQTKALESAGKLVSSLPERAVDGGMRAFYKALTDLGSLSEVYEMVALDSDEPHSLLVKLKLKGKVGEVVLEDAAEFSGYDDQLKEARTNFTRLWIARNRMRIINILSINPDTTEADQIVRLFKPTEDRRFPEALYEEQVGLRASVMMRMTEEKRRELKHEAAKLQTLDAFCYRLLTMLINKITLLNDDDLRLREKEKSIEALLDRARSKTMGLARKYASTVPSVSEESVVAYIERGDGQFWMDVVLASLRMLYMPIVHARTGQASAPDSPEIIDWLKLVNAVTSGGQLERDYRGALGQGPLSRTKDDLVTSSQRREEVTPVSPLKEDEAEERRESAPPAEPAPPPPIVVEKGGDVTEQDVQLVAMYMREHGRGGNEPHRILSNIALYSFLTASADDQFGAILPGERERTKLESLLRDDLAWKHMYIRMLILPRANGDSRGSVPLRLLLGSWRKQFMCYYDSIITRVRVNENMTILDSRVNAPTPPESNGILSVIMCPTSKGTSVSLRATMGEHGFLETFGPLAPQVEVVVRRGGTAYRAVLKRSAKDYSFVGTYPDPNGENHGTSGVYFVISVSPEGSVSLELRRPTFALRAVELDSRLNLAVHVVLCQKEPTRPTVTEMFALEKGVVALRDSVYGFPYSYYRSPFIGGDGGSLSMYLDGTVSNLSWASLVMAVIEGSHKEANIKGAEVHPLHQPSKSTIMAVTIREKDGLLWAPKITFHDGGGMGRKLAPPQFALLNYLIIKKDPRDTVGQPLRIIHNQAQFRDINAQPSIAVPMPVTITPNGQTIYESVYFFTDSGISAFSSPLFPSAVIPDAEMVGINIDQTSRCINCDAVGTDHSRRYLIALPNDPSGAVVMACSQKCADDYTSKTIA